MNRVLRLILTAAVAGLVVAACGGKATSISPEEAPAPAKQIEAAPIPPMPKAELSRQTVPENRPLLRGLWIHTWSEGMLSPEQIDDLVAFCREANLNAIFPEVRKVGDAYFNDAVEPRASNIQGPEDWDPLQYLIDKCHDTSDGKQYIEVHAWLVTFRLWRGELADVPEGHLFAEHPDTLMIRKDGGGEPSFADPGHPIVEDWTTRVFRELAANYDIDGIHHDYVRYPEHEGDWGYNETSLERFRKLSGFKGTPDGDHPAWNAWRREQVENTVRRVYAEVTEVNPDCLVSAATLNWGLEMSPWKWYTSTPRMKAQQDWPRFMEEGTLDMNCVMNYANAETQPHRFPDYTDLALRRRSDRHAIIGVGTYMNTIEDGFDQMRHAIAEGADGILIYAYQGLVRGDEIEPMEYARRLREEVFPERADPPARPWKDDPVYGMIIGQVTDENGDWIDGAEVLLDGVIPMKTSGTGFYAFTRVMPGTHSIIVSHEDGSAYRSEATIRAGQTVRADLVYKK